MVFNFRTITALLPKGLRKLLSNKYLAIHIRGYFFLFFVLLALVLLQLLVFLNARHQLARDNYAQKTKEYKYWTGVVSQFPNIPDILYNASLSAFNVGEDIEAKLYLSRALKIDPLFEKAIELRKEIGD